ncbi:MAG: Rieske (2Fe-2S) protein [Nitrososphaerota archaeon]|nr:Rieske (2Fe-2S) protein [Nitrososphaerota archaeon]
MFVVGGGALAGLATRLLSASQQAASTLPTGSQSGAPSGYIFVASLSALAGKTYAFFNHPTYGSSILAYYGGQWKAFSDVCTHAGCSVQFTGSTLYCPCHSGSFSPANGAVLGGPPPSPLPEYGVLVSGGDLYVTGTVIN